MVPPLNLWGRVSLARHSISDDKPHPKLCLQSPNWSHRRINQMSEITECCFYITGSYTCTCPSGYVGAGTTGLCFGKLSYVSFTAWIWRLGKSFSWHVAYICMFYFSFLDCPFLWVHITRKLFYVHLWPIYDMPTAFGVDLSLWLLCLEALQYVFQGFDGQMRSQHGFGYICIYFRLMSTTLWLWYCWPNEGWFQIALAI